jgi:hypothetical protein
MSNEKRIKGLQLEFTSEELIEHCKRRQDYHAALSKRYSDKVADALKNKANAVETMHKVTVDGPSFETYQIEEEEEKKFDNNAYSRFSNSANESFEADERKASFHRKKVKFFRLFGEHVIKGRIYRLMNHDMDTLEMV